MLKTCLQHIEFVLCKKTAKKDSYCSRNKSILKIAKNGHQASLRKILTLGRNLKLQKNMLKTYLQHIAVVLCKNSSKKELIYEKWGHLEKCQKWPPSKGYSLCNILTLGQKWKMQKKPDKNISTTHSSCSM